MLNHLKQWFVPPVFAGDLKRTHRAKLLNMIITISFGIATYPDHGTNAEELIRKADQALYQAKHAGRNRVTIWQGE
ncbi:MAG: diguanylate cyclase [Chloroflexales bacterium]